ncbi:hypothetical protein GSI_14260 [Ganoderma sinense ZZ0214-1]|uniref:Uncharacterized protein n=1 Tax=Ganoderma sinense ZZ0214-1 TaxID=1077348 RepID=A0A2G8RSL0_9APHY|nr:hypothetical protein GSI_14260 [Ganoderma sinense ZZ0214-1]
MSSANFGRHHRDPELRSNNHGSGPHRDNCDEHFGVAPLYPVLHDMLEQHDNYDPSNDHTESSQFRNVDHDQP